MENQKAQVPQKNKTADEKFFESLDVLEHSLTNDTEKELQPAYVPEYLLTKDTCLEALKFKQKEKTKLESEIKPEAIEQNSLVLPKWTQAQFKSWLYS